MNLLKPYKKNKAAAFPPFVFVSIKAKSKPYPVGFLNFETMFQEKKMSAGLLSVKPDS